MARDLRSEHLYSGSYKLHVLVLLSCNSNAFDSIVIIIVNTGKLRILCIEYL